MCITRQIFLLLISFNSFCVSAQQSDTIASYPAPDPQRFNLWGSVAFEPEDIIQYDSTHLVGLYRTGYTYYIASFDSLATADEPEGQWVSWAVYQADSNSAEVDVSLSFKIPEPAAGRELIIYRQDRWGNAMQIWNLGNRMCYLDLYTSTRGCSRGVDYSNGIIIIAGNNCAEGPKPGRYVLRGSEYVRRE